MGDVPVLALTELWLSLHTYLQAISFVGLIDANFQRMLS
jgi:hypothetical protein